jgi:hypothetical protein
MRHIVALSGGESSAAVAVMIADLKPILYFNDTKWEHPDLYRYIQDVSDYLGIPITNDSDGRSPAELAVNQHMLPNNRAPFCSRILKAERLQKFAKPGDIVYFGIGSHEAHRAARVRMIYTPMGIDSRFPLIENNIDLDGVNGIMRNTGIKKPAMYDMGFEHNNCNGGCVRQGARQWRHLFRVMPEVYAEREELESTFKPYTFMKDISLTKLREIEESQAEFIFNDDDWNGECIGICGSMI